MEKEAGGRSVARSGEGNMMVKGFPEGGPFELLENKKLANKIKVFTNKTNGIMIYIPYLIGQNKKRRRGI